MCSILLLLSIDICSVKRKGKELSSSVIFVFKPKSKKISLSSVSLIIILAVLSRGTMKTLVKSQTTEMAVILKLDDNFKSCVTQFRVILDDGGHKQTRCRFTLIYVRDAEAGVTNNEWMHMKKEANLIRIKTNQQNEGETERGERKW